MSKPSKSVAKRMGKSKLAAHADEVIEYVEQGQKNTWIAQQFDVDEATVRRFRVNHGINSVRPEDLKAPGGGTSVEWGFGRALPVEPAGGDDEVILVGSDMHFPYQDDRAIDGFINLIRTIKPHRVILNGDICDFFSLSTFNKSYERLDDLQDELDQGNHFRARVRTAAPNAIIDETEGNHDSRLITYVGKNARALKSLRGLRPESLIPYADLEINHHPGCGFLLRETFIVKHGTRVSTLPGGTARGELSMNGISGVSGHVHRSESAHINNYSNFSWNVSGTMSRLDPDYIEGMPNWNQSVLLIEISNRSGLSNVTNIPMFDGALRFACKAY